MSLTSTLPSITFALRISISLLLRYLICVLSELAIFIWGTVHSHIYSSLVTNGKFFKKSII